VKDWVHRRHRDNSGHEVSRDIENQRSVYTGPEETLHSNDNCSVTLRPGQCKPECQSKRYVTVWCIFGISGYRLEWFLGASSGRCWSTGPPPQLGRAVSDFDRSLVVCRTPLAPTGASLAGSRATHLSAFCGGSSTGVLMLCEGSGTCHGQLPDDHRSLFLSDLSFLPWRELEKE
jgi:hypothetical protein